MRSLAVCAGSEGALLGLPGTNAPCLSTRGALRLPGRVCEVSTDLLYPHVRARGRAKAALDRYVRRISWPGEFADVSSRTLTQGTDESVARGDICVQGRTGIAVGRLDLEELTRGIVLRAGNGQGFSGRVHLRIDRIEE